MGRQESPQLIERKGQVNTDDGQVNTVKINTECLLLMDADNAFNKLSRKVSLENIKRLCPPMYAYLHNSYNAPAMLYLENGDHILSQEGVTQGDNAAMAMYALST